MAGNAKNLAQTNLFVDVSLTQWPIVYCAAYNVRILGLEKMHPYDAGKWGHIFRYLKNAGLITEETVTQPNEAKKQDLLVVHSKKYLNSLKCSYTVAMILEIIPVTIVPNYFVQKVYLKPMRYQTGGSILAAKLALERGWAINLGGGFHHCQANKGGGFCPYADISLMIKFVFRQFPQTVYNILVVDLDAHQGNGYARDFRNNCNVYILDVYNKSIYPFDKVAKRYITRRVELLNYTEDEEYLGIVERSLQFALDEFNPQLIVYNAGTDILKGDSLGCLSVSPQGIIKRDEIVFTKARSHNIPIVMLLSGGYLKKTARIIATSIMNLNDMGLIQGPANEHKCLM